MWLSFVPLHLVTAIIMTVASAFISCMCCCVGKGAVDTYSAASLFAALLAFLRFLGSLGFVRAAVFGGDQADCEAERFRDWEEGYHHGCRECDDRPATDNDEGCACTMEEPYIYAEPWMEDCGHDPLGDEKVPLLIFVFLPWAAWCTALLLIRCCGHFCFARKWVAPTGLQVTQALVHPVATVSMAQGVPAGHGP